MRKVIHHLKKQPERVRRHILHVSTIVAGVILISLWVYSLGTNISNPDTTAKVSNDLKPLNALRANIIEGYKSLNDPQTAAPEAQ